MNRTLSLKARLGSSRTQNIRKLEIQQLEARQLLASDLANMLVAPNGDYGPVQAATSTGTAIPPAIPTYSFQANSAKSHDPNATKLGQSSTTVEYQKLGGTLSSFILTSSSISSPAIVKIADMYANTRKLVHVNSNQQILVDATAAGNAQDLKNDLQLLNSKVTGVYGRTVSAWVPISKLSAMSHLNSLKSARASMMVTNTGSVTSQADISLGAAGARTDFKTTGAGITVGVLSDSFDSDGDPNSTYRSAVVTQDLPPYGAVVLEEASGNDEGRAMLELIHDLAPDADLAFHTAFNGVADFAQGILDLQNFGANVIVDDVSYLAEPMYQDGPIAQAVDVVSSRGASYFSSAGNNGDHSWESEFKPKSFTFDTPRGPISLDLHDFGSNDPFQNINIPIGTQVSFSFQWSQPYGSVGLQSATGDIDIYLAGILDPFSTPPNTFPPIVTGSADFNVGFDPVEVFSFFNDGSFDFNADGFADEDFQLLLNFFEGAAPTEVKYVYYVDGSDPTIEYNTFSSTVYGHANAASAISVGAAFYQQTPAFGRPTQLESYSSKGGLEVWFDYNGFATQVKDTRVSPDIVATDGTNTTFFGFDVERDGFPNFFGTSAAAPHAAAIAALMLSAAGGPASLTPARIGTIMKSHTIEMGKPGFEFNTGYGYLDGYASVKAASVIGGVWLPEGPFSMTNGQNEGIMNKPVSGALTTVVAHPTNPDVLFVGGTNGGVWRTNNANSTTPVWIPLIDDQQSLSIGALAIDTRDATGNTIYVGNGNYSSFGRIGESRLGIIRSRDGGLTWQPIGGSALEGKNISGIVASGSVITVSVNTADSFTYPNIGIFRSTDGGANFQQISGAAGTGLPGGVSYDLTFDPTNPNVLYTSVVFPSGGSQGVYKSINAGATWTKVSIPAMDALITNNTSNLEIATGRQNNVYVAILNAGNLAGIFRSGDAGVTWTQMDTPKTNENGTDVGLNPNGSSGPMSGTPQEIAGGQGSIHFSMVANPNNKNIVYVGGDRQPRSFGDTGGFPNSIGALDFSGRLFVGDASKVAGQQFTPITHNQTKSSSAPHADSRDMVVLANGVLVETDDGGIYRNTAPGSTQGDWQSMIGNLQVTEMHDIAYDPVTKTLISGNQDTGTTFQPLFQSEVWKSLTTGDGGDVAVDKLAQAAQGNSVRYSSFQNLGGFRQTIVNSAGTTLATNFPPLQLTSGAALAKGFRTPIATNTVVGGHLLIQGTNNLYESLDSGLTIQQVGANLGTNSIEQDAIAYGGMLNGIPNQNVVWVGSGSDVFVRTASSFTRTLSDPTSKLVRDLSVSSIAYTTAAIVTTDEVFLTTDTGANWTNITGDLLTKSKQIRSVVYIPGILDFILVGTDHGVFASSKDTLGAWQSLGSELPDAMVYEMNYDAAADKLFVGTLGRGAWSLNKVSAVFTNQFNIYDFGDAPNSYGTSREFNGARHIAVGPTLGLDRDKEFNGVPSAKADSDDLNATTKDEDGVTFLNGAILGQTWNVQVVAPAGGFLNEWVDFNRNGTFEPSERFVSDLSLNPGTNLIARSFPTTASAGPSFVRFRITSAAGMVTSPTGPAADGEVEDYPLLISAKPPSLLTTGEVINGSFANTNRSGLGTLQLTFDQPVLIPNKTGLSLKNRTTNQTIDLTNVLLLGNGTAAVTWDFRNVPIPNGRYTYELGANAVTSLAGNPQTNTIAGYFHILTGDLSGDAKVDKTDSALASNYQSTSIGAPYRPGDANGDGRVNTADLALVGASFDSLGLAAMGIDFGDAKETGTSFPTTIPKSPTSLASIGASHAIVTGGPKFGTQEDAETNGQPNSNATGDGSDEDGVVFTNLRAGATGTATVRVQATGTVFLNAWIDFNGDGDWNDLGEKIANDRPTTAGTFALNFPIALTSPNFVFARFRIMSTAGYNYFGFAADGEVEDYQLNIASIVVPPPITSGLSSGIVSNGIGSLSTGQTGDLQTLSGVPTSTIVSMSPTSNSARLALRTQVGLAASAVRQSQENGQKNLDPSVLDQWFKKLGSKLLG